MTWPLLRWMCGIKSRHKDLELVTSPLGGPNPETMPLSRQGQSNQDRPPCPLENAQHSWVERSIQNGNAMMSKYHHLFISALAIWHECKSPMGIVCLDKYEKRSMMMELNFCQLHCSSMIFFFPPHKSSFGPFPLREQIGKALIHCFLTFSPYKVTSP